MDKHYFFTYFVYSASFQKGGSLQKYLQYDKIKIKVGNKNI